MTTYNTGNPIGSVDVKDLYDNAQNLDAAMNSGQETFVDRLGVTRKTWAGSTGYEILGAYAAGQEVTSFNQLIQADGEFWRLSAGQTLPYTTTGAGMPEGGAFVSVGDANLRQELASTDAGKGAELVAFKQSGAGAVPRTVDGKLKETVSVKDFGAVGNGVTDDTAAFSLAATRSRTVIVPFSSAGYRVESGVTNTVSTFLFQGGATQLVGSATPAQLKALFLDGGEYLGFPFAQSLRSSKIGIVAGSIRQRADDRTKWDYISDSAHTPIGLSGTFATAAGGSITIPFDTTYKRVISFVAGPDETFANRLGMSVGASVGLSNVVLNATACFSGAFTLRYDGANWVFASGTGQEIAPAFVSYTNGTLRVSHGYCRGISIQLTPFSNNGGVTNPYLPIVKVLGNDFVEIQWIDTTTGNIVTSASPSTRMIAVVQKMNNAGLFLDGTNNATTINGIDISSSANIWFYGIFEKN